MALILAFDTATPHLAVVLARDGRPVAWREDAAADRSHAERLNVYAQEVMADAGRRLEDLDAVAVGTGPGSYTGLRIGLSAAKGWCFALDKPLIGMPTLDILVAQALAEGRQPQGTLWPMVDARRMEVYARAFAGEGRPIGETAPAILDGAWCRVRLEEGPATVFGDGADKAAVLWQASPAITFWPGIRPGVKGLAHCAERSFIGGRFSNLAHLVPEYGKPANVAQQRGRL